MDCDNHDYCCYDDYHDYYDEHAATYHYDNDDEDDDYYCTLGLQTRGARKKLYTSALSMQKHSSDEF